MRSDVEIPGLNPGTAIGVSSLVQFTTKSKPDWVVEASLVRSEVIHSLPAEPECADPAFVVREYEGGKCFRLAYGDGTEFLVDRWGCHVWGTYVPPMTLEDLATYFLGPVMGFLLRRRGVTPLHASAIAVGDVAVAITGAAGTGKSTTAAALALRGSPVLCEDICALDESQGQFLVRPGYPRVCLWPDAVEKLLGETSALPNLTPTWDKKFLALDGGRARFGETSLPLHAVYLLGPRAANEDSPRLEEISGREALLELVQNTYMNALLNRDQRAAEFKLLSQLVAKVRCKRIIPHQDPRRIPALCDLIKADVRAASAERKSVFEERTQ